MTFIGCSLKEGGHWGSPDVGGGEKASVASGEKLIHDSSDKGSFQVSFLVVLLGLSGLLFSWVACFPRTKRGIERAPQGAAGTA